MCIIFCKDSASREQNKISLLIFYAKAKPMLSKDSASREQNKISLLIFYAKAKPMLSKDSASLLFRAGGLLLKVIQTENQVHITHNSKYQVVKYFSLPENSDCKSNLNIPDKFNLFISGSILEFFLLESKITIL